MIDKHYIVIVGDFNANVLIGMRRVWRFISKLYYPTSRGDKASNGEQVGYYTDICHMVSENRGVN